MSVPLPSDNHKRTHKLTISDGDYLRRLPAGCYSGHAFVHWTMTVEDRRTGWLDASAHACWRETLLHTLVRYQLAAPSYCLMPDHVHVLLVGLAPSSDQSRALSFLRRFSAAMLRSVDACWQRQAYDHVLRPDERSRDGFSALVAYLANNPVRAGHCEDPARWPYSGTVIAGWPDLHWNRPDFWELWWRIYAAAADGSARPKK